MNVKNVKVSSVIDPDPDPAFGSGYGSRVLMNKNGKIQLKFFFLFLKKKLQKKPSDLKREHPAFQKIKFINCFLFFGHICPLGFVLRIRIRIMDPIESGSIRIWIRIHNTKSKYSGRTKYSAFVSKFSEKYSPLRMI